MDIAFDSVLNGFASHGLCIDSNLTIDILALVSNTDVNIAYVVLVFLVDF